ncbi:MAG: hypothetical protein II863_02665, partial [Kiritimatiellae bacterium]|nr:hypothetical protein [Kiritimatiellia bacterium]
MATTFAMRLCAFQTFGPRRMPASRKPACAGHEMTRKEALFWAHIRRRLSDCGQTDAFDFCEARAKYRVGEVSREAEPAWAFSCA